jgi:CRISPR-associated protein Csx14
MDGTHILLATLGGQPQVVTFTLDLLLEKGYPISDVMVIHPQPSQPRLQHSLACLQREFADLYNGKHAIHFHSHVLRRNGHPIDDIIDNAHADATLNTIHQLIGNLKLQGYHIHLSVSGGRRLMSLLAISVAALNFDRHDHIWHIYTPAAIQAQVSEGQQMHAPSSAGVTLIESPFIALGAYIYNPAQTFQQAQTEQLNQMEAEERARCTYVIKEASPGQLKVLKAFSKGLRPQQVADHLGIELVTVHSHKTVLLRLCRHAWNISDNEHIDYHFLQAKFAHQFDNDE